MVFRRTLGLPLLCEAALKMHKRSAPFTKKECSSPCERQENKGLKRGGGIPAALAVVILAGQLPPPPPPRLPASPSLPPVIASSTTASLIVLSGPLCGASLFLLQPFGASLLRPSVPGCRPLSLCSAASLTCHVGRHDSLKGRGLGGRGPSFRTQESNNTKQ
ncbi:uncharacterized protein LOC134780862 [Penaeus indicus]|uniref:uncharacterized protein LOC134780862 n=1 Tax=Penaeus indicus TaxID=29960 RepID=UPI00300C6491